MQAYQKLPGLQHVLLLSGMEQAAWACHRSAEGPWGELMPWARGTEVRLPSLNVTLGWKEIYEGVGLG